MPKIWYKKDKNEIQVDNVNQVSTENETKITKEITVFEKICFSVAGLPYQMYFCAVSVFVTVFLLERAKLSATYTSYVLFISRF